MDHVWRRFHVDGDTSMKKYAIYTEAEAKREGIEYKPWRDASPGEYGLDDFGFVSKCVKKKIWYGKNGGEKRGEVQYPFAKAKLFQFGPEKFGYGFSKDPHWTEIDMTRKKVKMALTIYAEKLMSSETITEDDFMALGNICRPKDPEANRYIKRLLKHEAPKRFVMEKIKDVLGNSGVDRQYLVTKYQELLDKAVTKGQLAVAKAVLDKFADMLGVDDDKTYADRGTEHVLDWNKIMDVDGDNLVLSSTGDKSSSRRLEKGSVKTGD